MEITKKPFLMSFAGNPMRYLLSPESGGGGGGAEQLSVIQIEFTDIDSTPDHAIEVTMLGSTRTFTLKNSPTTKDHLPIADDAWNAARWCLACFEYILNDVQLSREYDIAMDSANIILTARTASPDYDWSEGSNTIVGVTVTTTQNGMAGTPGTVDGVRMQVWKNGTEKLGEDYKPLDTAGNVKFEVQEYINASLLQVPPPRFKLTGASYFKNVYTDYFLKYRTVFCDKISGVFDTRTYSDPDNLYCYAIAGGLNREDLVSNNQSLTDYFNLTATRKKFLSWAPPTRITDKFETHSLFFAFQTPSYGTYKLKANIYSSDTGSVISLSPNINVQYWSVVEFMAGYAQLGLSEFLSGGVNRWELYLVDGSDTIISDIRSFELDEKYAENTRYFRFRNSWGTYDSLRCTGVFENIIENDREKVMFRSDETETMYNTPGNYSIIKESQSFKANTGWLSKDFLNYLRDFMLSSDIYEVEDGKLLKCLLTSKKTSLFKDTQYNYSLAFEYERAWDDFFFQGLE
jgi:hypothetical protein